MSNIFTQSVSPEFTKQSLTEFFVDPMFMGEDIRGAITVRTDIKGTEKLNRISRPTMITKAKTTAGFTPNGDFALSTSDITVKPMAIEFEQNAREFWGSVLQEMLAQGYKEDDVENMSNPDIWNKIILPIIAQSGQQDLIRQMWFNDSDSADDNYNGYDGFFKNILTAIASGDITNLSLGTAAIPASSKVTIGGTPGNFVFTLKLNGNTYGSSFNSTTPAAFATWWVGLHASGILAGENITVTADDAGVITFTSNTNFTTTDAAFNSGTGTATISDLVNTAAAAFSTDEVDTTMDLMVGAMPNEMLGLNPVFRMSRKAYRNLLATWKALGTETANMIQFNGISVPSYEGIPIIVHPEWDTYAPLVGFYFPGIIVLGPSANLLFGTDGSTDSEMIESWYNQDEQMRRYRVQYKAQTAILHNELIIVAGLE